jgi:hypothetical protein
MRSIIRQKNLLFFGIIVLVIMGSSVTFGQTSCDTITIPIGSKFVPGKGRKIVSVESTGSEVIFTVCSENTTNPSPQNRPVLNDDIPRAPQTPTAEEIKQQKQQEKEERWANKRLWKDPGDTARDRKPQ